MRRHVAVTVGLVLAAVLLGTGAGVAGGADTEQPGNASIERVYPNPIASGDAGEYVVVSLPTDANLTTATLEDGTDTVSLANVSHRGRVAISPDPTRAKNLTTAPVANTSGLELANSGETLTLTVGGDVESRLRYTDAPEGKIGTRERGHLQWRTLGATDFDVTVADAGTVTTFVLPDNPDVPANVLRRADERILLAGYTLSSGRIADELIAAAERGATVRVLLEGEPVGARTRAEARQLDRLSEAGVDVRVVAGPYARVTYHHAKYAVADDSAIVLTENWKPAGTDGNSSRGWGAVTHQPAVVENLTATFEADAGWRDAVPWEEFRRGKTFERGERSLGDYPTNFEPQSVPVNRTELLVTPDNAGDRIVRTIDDADDSIAVVQASLGDWNDRLPTALRRAAQRDVEVRLLLSSAWYSKEENRRTVERFREWASRNAAPLSAKLADPNGRFEKIHAKGAIVDGDQVVVGSLNWNDAAMTSNREVLLLLHGSDVADYYGQVFDADWRGGGNGWSLPLGVVFAVVGCVCVAAVVLATVRFEGTVESHGNTAIDDGTRATDDGNTAVDDGPIGVGPPRTED